MENNQQEKKYKVCICAIIKDEFPYLLEWIAYHRAIGIDYFFIYDNESSDGSTELLISLAKAGVIEYIQWPSKVNRNNQIAAYQDVLLRAREKTEWIAVIDGDEFIVPRKHKHIHQFLLEHKNSSAIAINWKLFGSSQHQYKLNGLVMERFTRCAVKDSFVNGFFKTIAKIDLTQSFSINNCNFKDKNYKYVYPDGSIVKTKGGRDDYIDHNIIQINHYFCKSREEWIFKRLRGMADKPPDKKYRPDNNFDAHDQNEEEDRSILNFLESTKQEMESLILLTGLKSINSQIEKRNKYESALLKSNHQMVSVTSTKEIKNGNRLANMGNFEEAIAAYQFALKLNQSSPWSYYYLGNALVKLSKFEQAIEAYKSALKINPNVAWFNHDLGLAYNQLLLIDEAISCYQRTIAINPDFYKFHYDLGLVLYQKGNVEEALIYFKKAVELYPEFASGYKQLGDCFLKKEQLSAAIKSYQTAFQLKPNLLVKYYSSLAKALRKQGLLEEAIAIYCKIIEQNPEEYPNVPVVLSNNLGKFLESLQNLQNEKYPINYIQQINFPNPNYFKPPFTLEQNIHQNFCINSHSYAKNVMILVPKGRIWFNESWAFVLSDANDDILAKNCFRKPEITDIKPMIEHLPSVLDIDGRVVFLSSRWGYNYCHWMFDIISRLELLNQSRIKLDSIDKFVVNSYQKQFQKESLNIIGISQERVIESEVYCHIKARQIIYTSMPNQGIPGKWHCDFLRKKFLSLVPDKNISLERIYISREDSAVRRVVNETELIDFISKYGFISVTLSSMSFLEQVALFANARVIIAPHGAGFTNTVFCQPETKIIEIFGRDAIRNCYYVVASYCNLEYYYLICQSDNQRKDLPPKRDLDINVDMNLLFKLMQKAKIS